MNLENKGINKSKKQVFEGSLLRKDVVDYYSSKTREELEENFGTEVSRMVGFDQRNAHHCYDLWYHTLHTVERIDDTNLTEEQVKKIKVAAFFHDIGKPDVVGINPRNNQQNFYNHAVYSANIAKSILEKLDYSPEEIKQICFYIAHHDDFLNYKDTIGEKNKNHIFFREINQSTVEEIIVQNQINWEKLDICTYLPTHTEDENLNRNNANINSANNVKKRYICSTLVNGVEPEFKDFKGLPVEVDVNTDEIKSKISTGDYTAEYIPTEEDYKLLLELCKADAKAQSKNVIKIDPNTNEKIILDTRERKVKTIGDIGEVIRLAYIEGTKKFSNVSKKIQKKDLQNLTGYCNLEKCNNAAREALEEAQGKTSPKCLE